MSVAQTFAAAASVSFSCPSDFMIRLSEYLQSYGSSFSAAGGSVEARDSAGHWRIERRGAGLHVAVSAHDAAGRQRLCDTAAFLIDHIAPGLVDRLQWEGLGQEGALPANMHEAQLVSVRRLSPHFLRLRLRCAGLAALMTGGMHFSLLLPPEGRAPVWPSLNAAGRTVWPAGADKLHRAVFTFVDFDPQDHSFTFDLFEHKGGPATHWAQTARAGAQVVIAGPGGGEMSDLAADGSTTLVMAGDETALPAIRHILRNAPHDQRGFVLVETGDPADRLIADLPAGVTLHWLDRAQDEHLAHHLPHLPLPDARAPFQLWIAGEQGMIRAARKLFLEEAALPKTCCYLAGYWTAPK
ncbi:siderophore-interacting protein (plasmid) [Thioclava sp. 'Guangxiensis']|uniref:siderophore-interacting protein n=1 Tax=Thioclava sp. 'Guangxiensis' TaxID=3149044 RepID=UPI0032C43221